MTHIGRRGGAIRRQRNFGKCADCGKTRLLIGFLCRICYDGRNHSYYYYTDVKFREKCIERARKWRSGAHEEPIIAHPKKFGQLATIKRRMKP